MSFKDKVCVVTGAAQGIGEVYSKVAAEKGMAVVIADIDEEKGEQVANDIVKSGGKAIFAKTDVSSEESCSLMVAAATKAFGGIDKLINNAAIYGNMEMIPLLDVPIDYYTRFMSVNMNGCLIVTRAVHKSMIERGGGAIVNQSSIAAWSSTGGFYGIAKLGVHGLTLNLARELGPKNIRVNAIAPGPIDTEATRKVIPSEMVQGILRTMPLSRMGTPEDLVGTCFFLLSDEASWITGQAWAVDGGMAMRP